MKKIFFAALLALISLVGVAQGVVKISFDTMRISEDAGKTWSDPVKINGKFVIDGHKTVSLILGDDKQDYTITKSTKENDKTTIECTSADGESSTITFASKAKEVTITSSTGVINFKITEVAK